MKNNIIDTLHPSIGLVTILFILFFVISLFIIVTSLNPDDPNKVLVVSIFCIIILSLSYGTYRQRSIDFDGKEFYLENAFFRGIKIEASLFERIELIFSYTYRIRFTDGRTFIFLLNPLTNITKVVFTNDTDRYDKRLTKQVKEMIQKEKIQEL
ncbi:MAG: hypothetical protein HYZ54_13395 [Ignavibacteriae bacterium]|nr:hypothetical protein [Ignavibacteriota bacterium]